MSESRDRIRELTRKRDELAASLAGLDKQRSDTVQRNSYARARQRAGVTDSPQEEMSRLGTEEDAAHGALRDVRGEMHRLDAEIEREKRAQGSRLGRLLRR